MTCEEDVDVVQWSLATRTQQQHIEAHVGVSKERLHNQGAAWLIEADGNAGTQGLAQGQHLLEVLQVKSDVSNCIGVVLVLQEDFPRVQGQLGQERFLHLSCIQNSN